MEKLKTATILLFMSVSNMIGFVNPVLICLILNKIYYLCFIGSVETALHLSRKIKGQYYIRIFSGMNSIPCFEVIFPQY